MTTRRLAILITIIGIGFSSVFLLPKSAAQPFGVRHDGKKIELPSTIGDWWGTEAEVTKKEKETLGAGTEFARMSFKNYMLDKQMSGYSLLVSIVLSGHDMSNSIRYNFIYRPGSDLYVVYTDLRQTGLPLSALAPSDRQLAIKFTYLLAR